MAGNLNDKALIGAALALVLVSAAAFATLTARKVGMPRGSVATVQLQDGPYTPAIAEASPVKTDTWTPPGAQSRGREWIYDTFTPPEIFYSARTKQFTVRPPQGLTEDEVEEVFGLELQSVKPEPFRLQLIGYVGGDGNWRGTFENVLTGEVFLASAGRRVGSLALSIISLDVQPQPVVLDHSMTTNQRVATAIVRDERNGRNVTLTHRQRHYTGTGFAFLTLTGQSSMREVRAGDAFKLGEITYRIDRVQIAPPAVEITKETPGLPQPERRTLLPRDVEDAPPSASFLSKLSTAAFVTLP
ncbi:MAG: hypothetical protein EXS43_11045 [Opitutus sp.]|nr:hypothetical protein [Opitutus sp.]